ncbi:MAG: hypothetical protein HC812_19810 [Leptolyngbya sp. RL_3_1]|nr:hypothetical protein [Leptolyngbya sp. RL_3_1]
MPGSPGYGEGNSALSLGTLIKGGQNGDRWLTIGGTGGLGQGVAAAALGLQGQGW